MKASTENPPFSFYAEGEPEVLSVSEAESAAMDDDLWFDFLPVEDTLGVKWSMWIADPETIWGDI